ncbi:hypothetical protein [Celeribacter sp. PS-C1]|uniref:hypothetical protein n=1 Tax=Celeribacter sp. PS-C1 TaxID=2820813 RepID=UPI001CA54AE7|nr:hypothetical protein [Celeribacter sp. PS-C1]MBW6418292.1 hypothetical protein [Celeribacter sp. PS-C1]
MSLGFKIGVWAFFLPLPVMGMSFEVGEEVCSLSVARSDTVLDQGTSIFGLSFSQNACEAVNVLRERGFTCRVDLHGDGPFCGGKVQERWAAVSGGVVCSKEASDGVEEAQVRIGTNFQFRKEVNSVLHDEYGRCIFPQVSKADLYLAWREAKSGFPDSEISRFDYSCSSINSCTMTSEKIVDGLLERFDDVSRVSFGADARLGQALGYVLPYLVTKFGEQIYVHESSKSLLFRRGDFDQFKPGGLALE